VDIGMSDVRPVLTGVEFFYRADYEKEDIRVKRTLVYDQQAQTIILGQTAPPTLKSSITKAIVVTYLVKKEGRPSRFGFPANILDIINNYEISSGEKVPAIVIEQVDKPRPFNIRSNFRLRVPSFGAITMRIRGEKLNLIDVSIGGAMVSGISSIALHPNERIKATIVFGNQPYEVEAEVMRTWSPDSKTGQRDVQFASLMFINATMPFEIALGRAIFALERRLLAGE
jgi:hypothetical protein